MPYLFTFGITHQCFDFEAPRDSKGKTHCNENHILGEDHFINHSNYHWVLLPLKTVKTVAKQMEDCKSLEELKKVYEEHQTIAPFLGLCASYHSLEHDELFDSKTNKMRDGIAPEVLFKYFDIGVHKARSHLNLLQVGCDITDRLMFHSYSKCCGQKTHPNPICDLTMAQSHESDEIEWSWVHGLHYCYAVSNMKNPIPD